MKPRAENIRASILVPLSIVLLLLGGVIVTAAYLHQQYTIETAALSQMAGMRAQLDREFGKDARILSNFIDILLQDPGVSEAWLREDRAALLSRSWTLLSAYEQEQRVSHLNYISLDRVCALRVRHPASHGDTLGQATLSRAAAKGVRLHGLELSRWGCLSVWVVHPWQIDGEVVGYLQLGGDMDKVVADLSEALDLDIIVTLDKAYLDQSLWEVGLRQHGGNGDWSHLPDDVILASSVTEHSAAVAAAFDLPENTRYADIGRIQAGEHSYRTRFQSLFDGSDRHVGDLVALCDVTLQEASLRSRTTFVIAVCILLGGLLAGMFYVYLGSIQRCVREAEDELRNEIAERARAEEARHKSESLFRTVCHATREAMISVDQSGRIALFNPAAEGMFGLDRREVIGQPLDRLMPEEYRQRHRENVRSFFARGGSNKAIGRLLELPALRSDGTTFPMEISLSTGEHGHQKFVFAVARDITERKKVEKELLQAKEEAEATNRAMGDLLTDMNREIRPSLDGIVAAGQRMLETGLDSRQREHAESILRSGQALLGTIDEILDLSRIEAGHNTSTTPQPVSG